MAIGIDSAATLVRVLDLLLLRPEEIDSRYNSNHLAIPNDRKVTAAIVVHEPQSIARDPLGRDGVGMGCHDIGENRSRRISSLGQDPIDRVTRREYPLQLLRRCRDQNRTDLMLSHRLRRLSRGRRRRQCHGVLSDDVEQSSHSPCSFSLGWPLYAVSEWTSGRALKLSHRKLVSAVERMKETRDRLLHAHDRHRHDRKPEQDSDRSESAVKLGAERVEIPCLGDQNLFHIDLPSPLTV